jgi:hypothetical protein
MLSGPSLLSCMLERIATLMHCERASLFMLDRQSRSLAVAAEWRTNDDNQGGIAHLVTTPITLTADKGVLGYTARSVILSLFLSALAFIVDMTLENM